MYDGPLIGSCFHLQPSASLLLLGSIGYRFAPGARLSQTCLFLPSTSTKRGVGIFVPSLSPYRLPSVMADSLYSSRTAFTDPAEGHDPEALRKVEDPSAGDDNASEKGPPPWEVTLDKSEDPKTVTAWRKWAILLTVSSGAMCVTSASSMVGVMQDVGPQSDLTRSDIQAAFAEAGIMKEFGISHTVSILPMSLFMVGLGIGPLLVGPLSEVHGVLHEFHSSAGR